ncbi:hypothetical protein SLEP1_g17584 [Rubroshorea leprosula]|uniref:Protein kinase domain-containing protein n=1 Tax=Rubroshorea leprosula TaxID=152421 RepID=A0AAV5J594_9ROSI|nr:hypothetical protein SLEP1_g17584 [Rubroshorea leprosula]
MMAANELNAYAFLQSSLRAKGICKNILLLLGEFETKAGEQWLAFRNDGKYSAADFAKITSEQISRAHILGEKSPGPSEQNQTIKSRMHFVVKILQGAMSGLADMHNHNRLHPSLGPASVVLNTIIDATYLVPRVRDLAFSVDIRYGRTVLFLVFSRLVCSFDFSGTLH